MKFTFIEMSKNLVLEALELCEEDDFNRKKFFLLFNSAKN